MGSLDGGALIELTLHCQVASRDECAFVLPQANPKWGLQQHDDVTFAHYSL